MALVPQARSREALGPLWVRLLAAFIPLTFAAVGMGMLASWGTEAVRQFNPFAVVLAIACIGTLRHSRVWAHVALTQLSVWR
jgi:hypothetical protein